MILIMHYMFFPLSIYFMLKSQSVLFPLYHSSLTITVKLESTNSSVLKSWRLLRVTVEMVIQQIVYININLWFAPGTICQSCQYRKWNNFWPIRFESSTVVESSIRIYTKHHSLLDTLKLVVIILDSSYVKNIFLSYMSIYISVFLTFTLQYC